MKKKPNRIELSIPASTSNLGPGFDAVGLAVGLYNEFLFERIESGLQIHIEGEGADILPRGPEHRTFQAFQKACQILGRRVPGLKIIQRNSVPLARGLGGSGISVLAGTLAAFLLNGMEPDSTQVLDQSFAIETHPDNITPSLVGGLTVSVIDDGHVAYIKLNPPSNLTTVTLVPDHSLDTGLARKAVPQQFSREDAVFNIRGAAALIAALATGRLDHLALAMRDRMHQPYRAPLLPGMMEIFRAALGAGSPGVALSGSGSGVFAFAYAGNEQAIGQAMKAAAARFGIKAYSLCLPVDLVGAKIVSVS
jgi:homoserine kinase